MMRLSLKEAAACVHGTLHGDDAVFAGLSTDSRSVATGELFVALRGPSFDGHDYVAAAMARGACAALVETPVAGVPCISVANSRAALGPLSRAWRERFQVDAVAITGSNGKTTVKEMVAAILARDAPVLATQGNLNNDIGVPLTLARLDESHRRLVVEMGANHVGEIAGLATLVSPRVGVITVIAPAHLEGFGSIEAIARAKGELITALPADGVAVVNGDDARFQALWRELAAERSLVRFGFGDDADVRVVYQSGTAGNRIRLDTPVGNVEARLRLAGRHNAANAAAATAAALAMNVPLDCVRAGLEDMRAVRGRLAIHETRAGVRVIDDSYNANPHSLAAALDVLAEAPAPRWLVLGDMAELGDDAESFHHEAGLQAQRAGVERLFSVGHLAQHTARSFGAGARHFADRDALSRALREELAVGVTVLVKGSRSAGMESVVRVLLPPPTRLHGEAACS